MTDDTTNKLLTELIGEFNNDISKTIKSLSSKIRLDIYPKIVEVIGTDDVVQVEEAKKFLFDATEIIANDTIEHLTEFFKKYQH